MLAVWMNTTPVSLRTALVVEGPLEVWSAYPGKLESREAGIVMSSLGGGATITFILPEGSVVSRGDVLVRLDSSRVERDLVKLERDYALAQSEYDSLKNAEIPLKQRELEMLQMETKANYEAEFQFLQDSRKLLDEGLVSEQEIKQQEWKVEQLQKKLEQAEMQSDLARQHQHPSLLEQAEAKLNSAKKELEYARQEMGNCEIRAPADGMLVYMPVHLGSEFRTARVGDTIYRNQPFLAIPDMSNLIVRCNVPESELSRVHAGDAVSVNLAAYPDLRLPGRVERVGTMAQSLAERPSWEKYFVVVVGLVEGDPRLRSGMSVHARVLSFRNPNAVLVPRAAVEWVDGAPQCKWVRGRRQELRPLKLGMADETRYEVLDGLEPGDRVALE
jgi:multidrug efflux pump subunit AcrA (membrane-fusion protein)